MPLIEISQHKEHPKSHWVRMNQIPTIDYWFGNQYRGRFSESFMLNIGLITDVCRQTYLPPLVLANVSNNVEKTGSKFPTATLEPLDELWKGVPIGWFIRVNSSRLAGRSDDLNTTKSAEELAAERLDRIIKQSLLKAGIYETLNLRLRTLDQIKGMTGRGLRQVTAVLGAGISAVGIEDIRVQIPLAILGFAVIQNFMGLRRDISAPVYYRDDEMEIDRSPRDMVEQWRRHHFGDQYFRERLGPGIVKNILVHSIPFSEIGEPLVRHCFAVPELREKFVKIG